MRCFLFSVSSGFFFKNIFSLFKIAGWLLNSCLALLLLLLLPLQLSVKNSLVAMLLLLQQLFLFQPIVFFVIDNVSCCFCCCCCVKRLTKKIGMMLSSAMGRNIFSSKLRHPVLLYRLYMLFLQPLFFVVVLIH